MVAGIALLASGLPAGADNMMGQASIIDGDTLEIHGNRIGLWGIQQAAGTTASSTDGVPYYCNWCSPAPWRAPALPNT
jgi:hypothetical protein